MSKPIPSPRYIDPALALANRLSEDDSADRLALASSSADSAIPTVRNSTTRELLLGAPRAARRLTRIVESGSDKDAIAAANLILSKSPATPVSANTLSGASFSAEALEVLFKGLANFASLAGARSAGSPISDPFIDATVVEEQQ
jgi:hypothetical protein